MSKKKIFNYLRSHRLPLLLITLVTVLVWYKLLNQTLLGEGYYYFDRNQDFFRNGRIIADLGQTDMLGRILFDILPPLFKDNTSLYLAFQLFTMVLLHLTFYLTVFYFTRKKSIALWSSLFFTGSYIGQFEMLGTGNYQRFVQRVPNIIILLISLTYLAKYLNTRKLKNLLISYLTFACAVFLAHFSTFLLPLFVIYPIYWSIIYDRSLRQLLKLIPLLLPFFVVNYFLISSDHLTPTTNIIKFLLTEKGLIEKVLLQFASINLPPFLLEKIAAVANPYTTAITIAAFPVIVIYLLGAIVLYRRSKNIFVLYISCLTLIPVLLILNLYLGKVDPAFDIRGYNYYFIPKYYIGQINTLTNIKGDRYYFVPTFFVGIIVSTMIWILFSKKKKLYNTIFAFTIVIYILYNTALIWNTFDKLQPISDDIKSYVSYVMQFKDEFKPTTYIVTPEYFLWPSQMIRALHGYDDMKFIALNKGWEKEIPEKSRNNVIIVDYDYRNKMFSRLKYIYN